MKTFIFVLMTISFVTAEACTITCINDDNETTQITGSSECTVNRAQSSCQTNGYAKAIKACGDWRIRDFEYRNECREL